MTFRLVDRRTHKTVSAGQTLQMAAYYCQTNRHLVMIPEKVG